MEPLSLRTEQFGKGLISKFDDHASGRWSPRLPTPETSRSSLDSREPSIISAPRDAFMRSRAEMMGPHIDTSFAKARMESASRDGNAPHSPPYDPSDADRPSLPPLKALLENTMASPPRTPKALPASRQLMPFEPNYYTDVYKPVSLYPNKKTKVEDTHHQAPVHAPATHASHPSIISPQKPYSASERRPNYHDGVARHPYDESPVRPVHHSGNAPTSLPPMYDRPHSAGVKRSWSGSMASPSYDARTSHYRGEDLRYSQYPDAQYVQMRSPGQDRMYLTPTPDGYSRVEGAGQYGRADHGPTHGHPPPHPEYRFYDDQAYEGYPSTRYEYYYPKARKRSNLPKHSTEIMRAWFDQNIANPYPSEDQKAIFANATGISLTQVSNWFINHRRRCPELRDKRAERRKV